MAEDGKIVYRVVIDSTGAVTAAEEAGKQAGKGLEKGAEPHTGKFEQVMIGAARRIGEAFVDMSMRAVDGVKQIAQAGVEFNAKMETYQTAFTTLLGSGEEAARVMEQIRKDAAATPFDVDSLTQANQLLIAAGVSAGDARNDVLNLANAIAATGGGSAELSRMAANMQQIKNVGKATAMDIRQFANAGINIYSLLADYTGKTVAEVSELDVSYDMLAGALAHASAEGGKFAGAMEKQSQTFTGRISTLKDNATLLAGELTADLFDRLSGDALPMVIDWVGTLLEAAQTGGIEGAITAAQGILSGLVDSFLEGLPQMLDTGLNLLDGLLNGLADNSGRVIEVITQVLLILVQAIVSHLPQLLHTGVRLLSALIQGIAQAAPQLFGLALQLIGQLISYFFHGDWITIGWEIVNGISEGIRQLWDGLVQQVQDAVSRLWNAAKRALGIASPSKKFKYLAEMSVEGMEEGFEDGETELTRTVTDVMGGTLGAAAGGLGVSGGDMERSVSYNLAATTSGSTIVVPLTIDGREIARATAWSMGEQLAWEEM